MGDFQVLRRHENRSPKITPNANAGERELIETRIQEVLCQLGSGKVDVVAYDTAWVARLASHYPNQGFDRAFEWLRRHQHVDGTWGAPHVHFHDRFISTLAAIIALQEAGRDPRDQRRVKRGEDALWKLVGKLGRDDSDTVGFPILSAALAQEATALGLDVPCPPVRYSVPYKKKVESLLSQARRNWRASTLTFSLESFRQAISEEDDLLEANHSVGGSPAATVAYLLKTYNEHALRYVQSTMESDASGGVTAVKPIDVFEISWAIGHLSAACAIDRGNPEVIRVLKHLWSVWSEETGSSYSSSFAIPDIDDTAASYGALHWGGYPVSADVFAYYEGEEHFSCYRGETNPSLSAHIRVIKALQMGTESDRKQQWIAKAVKALRRLDENGSFWWDKWHSSPYYLNSSAINVLYGIADDLVSSRLKWILRTQNDDGGWGYLDSSTPEETAYVLEALLEWGRIAEPVDSSILDAAANYLWSHLDDSHNTPLYIVKTLFTPTYVVQSTILSALYRYINQNE